MDARELRQLPDNELREKTREIRERLFNLGFKGTTESITNPAEVTGLRRDIARIYTILTERERAGAPARPKLTRAARKALKAGAEHLEGAAAKKIGKKKAQRAPVAKEKKA